MGKLALDTGVSDPEVWRRLGRLAYKRREELRLTQKQLAEQSGTSPGAVQRLEAGQPTSRRAATWPKIEAGLEWPKGFIEDFLTGVVLGPPEPADDEGRFTRQQKNDQTDIVRDLVRMITLEVAPGTPIRKVLELEEQAIEFARQRGFKGPPEAPPTSRDVGGDT